MNTTQYTKSFGDNTENREAMKRFPKMGDEPTIKNIFKCECGNHQSFRSLEKLDSENTFYTQCQYCGATSDMKFVESVEVEN